ncbi:MAG: AMP-binding protein [Actinomycetota bacterium]
MAVQGSTPGGDPRGEGSPPSVGFDVDHPAGATLDRWIERVGEAMPSATAFVTDDGSIAYADLHRRVRITAGGLVASGVGHGDRVAFCGLNRVELFETLFACARLGAVLVPFNNRLTAGELAYQIVDCTPTVVLTTDGFDGLLTEAVIAADLVEAPAVRSLDRQPFGPDDDAVDAIEPPSTGTIADPVLMVYTSGTTGRPKGAVLTQRAVAYAVANGVEHQRIAADDVILAVLPTFHVGGINIQTMPALAVGATVVLLLRFDPGAALDAIARHRPTHTVFVPAVLDAVAAHERFATTELDCLVGINSGSSVVPVASMTPYFDRGVPVGQVYGATETGPTAVVLDYDRARAHQGAAGRPARHTEIRIEVDGEPAPQGRSGEILVRGPHLFDGYWNNPEATAEAFVDGWYRTGDVGRIDVHGLLHVHDRVRDMFITGGENVYPVEVEDVLAGHPAIAEVTVVARTHERWGEVGVAVVVPVDVAGPELTIDGLRAWCEGRLARFKQPRELLVVDALPRTALGKVRKHVVRAELGLDGGRS